MDATFHAQTVLQAWLAHPPMLVLVSILLPVAFFSYTDYRNWYNLGPGGLPHNAVGWAVQSFLRLVCSSDVKGLAYYDHYITGFEKRHYLPDTLAKREGKCPKIGKWAAPHRQLDMTANTSSKRKVRQAFADLAANKPQLLVSGPSIIEGGSPALFISSKRGLPKHDYYKKAPYEVIHMHETDGSLHCILSAADAKLLIQKGWGERHGLNGKIGFPRGYLMVYAPRDESELDVILSIMKAAAQYGLGGEDVLWS